MPKNEEKEKKKEKEKEIKEERRKENKERILNRCIVYERFFSLIVFAFVTNYYSLHGPYNRRKIVAAVGVYEGEKRVRIPLSPWNIIRIIMNLRKSRHLGVFEMARRQRDKF